MKSSGLNSFKLPIFNWLFFLFLTSGISYVQHAYNTVSVELIDSVSRTIDKKNNIAQYSCNTLKKTAYQKPHCYLLQLNSLSRKLDNLVLVSLTNSFEDILAQNTVSHFRSRTLTSGNSDDFIS